MSLVNELTRNIDKLLEDNDFRLAARAVIFFLFYFLLHLKDFTFPSRNDLLSGLLLNQYIPVARAARLRRRREVVAQA